MEKDSKEIVTYTIDKKNHIISFDEGWETAATTGAASDLLQKTMY